MEGQGSPLETNRLLAANGSILPLLADVLHER